MFIILNAQRFWSNVLVDPKGITSLGPYSIPMFRHMQDGFHATLGRVLDRLPPSQRGSVSISDLGEVREETEARAFLERVGGSLAQIPTAIYQRAAREALQGIWKLDASGQPQPAVYRSLLIEEMEIGGIPTAIVDGHQDVLPFWSHHLRGRAANLLHIDTHPDTTGLPVGLRLYEDAIVPPQHEALLVEYVRIWLAEGNFICPADILGLIGAIYCLNPRWEPIFVFRDPKESEKELPRVQGKVGERAVGWVGPYADFSAVVPGWGMEGYVFGDIDIYISRPREIIAGRLGEDRTAPLILDIDLDAFECCLYPNEGEVPFDEYQRRIRETFSYLRLLPRPTLITIARSQTHNRPWYADHFPGLYLDVGPYCPPHRVDAIQEEVIRNLFLIFGS